MGADYSYDMFAGSDGTGDYEYNDYSSSSSSSNSLNYYSSFWDPSESFSGSMSVGGASSTGFTSAPGAPVANTGGANWWDSVSSWLTEGTGPKKSGPSVLSMAMPSLVSGGLATLSELFTGNKKKAAKVMQQQGDAAELNAQSNAARVAQTSYGNSMPKMTKPAGGLMYHGVKINRPTVRGIT